MKGQFSSWHINIGPFLLPIAEGDRVNIPHQDATLDRQDPVPRRSITTENLGRHLEVIEARKVGGMAILHVVLGLCEGPKSENKERQAGF